jgi:hypothetical protein
MSHGPYPTRRIVVAPMDEVKRPNEVACDSMRWEALSLSAAKDSTVCYRVDPFRATHYNRPYERSGEIARRGPA